MHHRHGCERACNVDLCRHCATTKHGSFSVATASELHFARPLLTFLVALRSQHLQRSFLANMDEHDAVNVGLTMCCFVEFALSEPAIVLFDRSAEQKDIKHNDITKPLALRTCAASSSSSIEFERLGRCFIAKELPTTTIPSNSENHRR